MDCCERCGGGLCREEGCERGADANQQFPFYCDEHGLLEAQASAVQELRAARRPYEQGLVTAHHDPARYAVTMGGYGVHGLNCPVIRREVAYLDGLGDDPEAAWAEQMGRDLRYPRVWDAIDALNSKTRDHTKRRRCLICGGP